MLRLTRSLADAIANEKRLRLVEGDADLTLSGEVRAAGERLRVRLRVTGPDGATHWSAHVDGMANDPFSLEDALVREGTSGLRALGMPRQGPDDERLGPDFEKARALVGELDPNAWREALDILESMQRDTPNEPSILSLRALAMAMQWMVAAGSAAPDFIAQAEEFALRALDAAPDHLDAYLAIATVRRGTGDLRGAVAALHQALAHSPAFGAAHHMLGRILCDTGRVDEGMRRIAVARRLGHGGGLALSVELRLRAILGDREWVRAELERVRGTKTELSLAPVVGEFAVWWEDRVLAQRTAEHFERQRWGGAWGPVANALRKYARGESITERLVVPPSANTEWSRTRLGMIVASLASRNDQRDAALDAVEIAAGEPTFIELLWLDRAPTLALLRDDPRYAAARARVAARVADIGL